MLIHFRKTERQFWCDFTNLSSWSQWSQFVNKCCYCSDTNFLQFSYLFSLFSPFIILPAPSIVIVSLITRGCLYLVRSTCKLWTFPNLKTPNVLEAWQVMWLISHVLPLEVGVWCFYLHFESAFFNSFDGHSWTLKSIKFIFDVITPFPLKRVVKGLFGEIKQKIYSLKFCQSKTYFTGSKSTSSEIFVFFLSKFCLFASHLTFYVW